MATELQRHRLRDDIDASVATLNDDDVDDIYLRAADSYADAGTAQDAMARIIAIRRLLANSAKLTSYRQNASSENASDVFKHLKQLLEVWQGELNFAVSSSRTNGAARFGSTKRIPPRIREYPD